MLIPSLVFCPTDKCDMRCEYCPTEGDGSYGENFEIARHPLDPGAIVWAANNIGSLGFTTFRLTGGEPLLDISTVVAILRGVVDGGHFSNVRLNTNGSRLLTAIDSLKGIPFSALKVSLDTLDPNLFYRITKSKKHSDVLRGIERAKQAGLPVEVNSVLTNETAPGMMDLVRWCQERGIPVKILDLVSYDSQPTGYIKLHKIVGADLDKSLRESYGPPDIIQLSDNRGIYMKRYGPFPYVLFKDCAEGTTFTNYWHGCPHFPCEEGIHHLSISTDGHLRPCRIRNNIFWDLRPITATQDGSSLTHLIRFLLDNYYAGEFSSAPGKKTLTTRTRDGIQPQQ